VLTALKKLVGVVVLVAILFGVAGPGLVFAQAEPVEEATRTVGGVNLSDDDIKNAINSPTPNLANTTAYIFYTTLVLLKGMSDSDLASVKSAQAPDSLGSALSQGGAIGGVGFLIGSLIGNPPASFGYYAADLIHHSRFGAQPAYAQGVGFGALTPILGTWNAFKNIAYYILTIMFFITGFLILIRHKVSGNVAVTVQNALPRLVITLIVITFSYAIAGLIVDLMYLAIYFLISVFGTQIFQPDFHFDSVFSGSVDLRGLAFDVNIFDFTILYIFGKGVGAWALAQSLGDLIGDAVSNVKLLGPLGDDGTVRDIFTEIIGALFYIIIAVAIFIAMFRVFFALVMSYAGFVINVVLSPLILLEGAIPGRNPWTKWLKNLIAGLLPFVVVIFMIFMTFALTGDPEVTQPGIGYRSSSDQGVTGLRLPLIGGKNLDANVFLGVLAMGFILLMPEAVKMSREAVGAKGGPFDQYKDKITGALKQGWQGSGYVPGAKNIVAGAGAGAVTGAAAGMYGGATLGGRAPEKLRPFAKIGGAVAGAAGGVALGGVTGGAVTAGGTPVFRGIQSIFRATKPYVEKADTALTKARDYREPARARRELAQQGENRPEQVVIEGKSDTA
jgi:hypothetical protein